MVKHKNKIIAAVAGLAILAGAWFYGGNYGKNNSAPPATAAQSSEEPAAGTITPEPTGLGFPPSVAAAPDVTGTDDDTLLSHDERRSPAQEDPLPEASAESYDAGASAESPDAGTPGAYPEIPSETASITTSETDRGVSTETAPDAPAVTTPDAPTGEPAAATGQEPGKDKYKTDPVPEGKPLPVELEDAAVGDGSFTVTLTVRCDTILGNMELLNKEKRELVPEDGVIFPVTSVTAFEGESVFNVLHRAMKQAKIHMAFRNTPIYNSAYIEAINNLYEFDAGELSGWMYCVNGWYPNYGCSRYRIQPGDMIEWNYTCDLGRDLGQFWVTKGLPDE